MTLSCESGSFSALFLRDCLCTDPQPENLQQGQKRRLPYLDQAAHQLLGITTGLKLGNAVKRNRARRRIRELYRTNESRLLRTSLLGYDIVVVARTRVIYGSYGELERSFLQLMRKLGICPPRGSAE